MLELHTGLGFSAALSSVKAQGSMNLASNTHAASNPKREETISEFQLLALLEGEDESAYLKPLAQVTAAVEPKDVIAEFWVRDVVDLAWEALRLRRLKDRPPQRLALASKWLATTTSRWAESKIERRRRLSQGRRRYT